MKNDLSEALTLLMKCETPKPDKVSESDVERLVMTLNVIGLPCTVREALGDEQYHYLFIGKPEDASCLTGMDDNFETTELDGLLMRHKFLEFENGALASWQAS